MSHSPVIYLPRSYTMCVWILTVISTSTYSKQYWLARGNWTMSIDLFPYGDTLSLDSNNAQMLLPEISTGKLMF